MTYPPAFLFGGASRTSQSGQSQTVHDPVTDWSKVIHGAPVLTPKRRAVPTELPRRLSDPTTDIRADGRSHHQTFQ
jgi:hypothetical protein